MATKTENIFGNPQPEYGTTEATPKKGIVAKDIVNFRKEAKADAKTIKALAKNTEVTILGDVGDYYNVEYDHEKGYIRKDLVDPKEG